jgi:pyruvate, orthophosphate dikinase
MTIAELAAKYEQYVIDMRREFHENPELSHHEERTVRRIREELDKLGIPNITVGHNNVIGTLEGGKPGKKIAIRADIDALPVAEANEVPYKSKVEGVMHACGHDGHAAMLLGTAHVLSEIRDQLCGTVYLCFQVAEEIGAGADEIVAYLGSIGGVDQAIGTHLAGGDPAGVINLPDGPMMAGALGFEITVKGVGGHGSRPDRAVDPVKPACDIVLKIAMIPAQYHNPFDTCVVSPCQITAGNKDMQDMEFTIERGKLFMLQTRNGKRTAQAAMKIACDLVDEGLITEEQAVLLVDPSQLDAFLHDQFNPAELKRAKILATALPASPGAACGQVVFDAETAKEWVAEGKKVILVRLETSPEDIEGMHISEGILTVRGGMTSHAAVVARGMGICCISSCGDITIREGEHCFEVDGLIVNEGDYISLDGSTGRVYLGKISTVGAGLSGDYSRLMGWADKFRKLQVRANAETPADAAQAYKFGAEGIGLVRTEHMFFDEQKIKAVREMILAKTQTQRQKAVDKMHMMQREDFIKVFEAMQGQPVTIRLIDPPLHEFLPKEGENLEALAAELETTPAALEKAIVELHEVNPMMGHRGCRLAVSYPEIAKMQTEAIIEAAITVTEAHKDWRFVPEIMVPLITDLKELKYIKGIIVAAAEAVLKAHDSDLKYMIGTMVETPRAALLADEIATEADFYSFGTNDLTQMTFGLSRDDAASYLGSYYDKKIFDFDPFATLDLRGVGQLIERATELGRSVKPNLKLGICGEHGGDPASVEFCHKVGLNYVSCSPYRVPIARLAAAQAAIKFPRD